MNPSIRLDPSTAGRLTGRILDRDDLPVPGARVTAAAAGLTFPAAVSADGRFEVTGLPEGLAVSLDYGAPGHRHGLERIEPDGGAEEIRLVLERVLTIAGRVRRKGREPVGRARISGGPIEVYTDAEGRFLIPGLRPRTVELEVNPREETLAVARVEVDAGARDVEVVLSPGHSLTVRADVPADARASVGIDRLGDGPRVSKEAPAHDGSFRSARLPAGRYRAWARARGCLPAEAEVEVPGPEVVLRPDSGLVIAGEVVDEAGRPVGPAIVRVEPVGAGSEWIVLVRETGRFRAEGLAAGRYRPLATTETALSETVEVEAGTGGLRIVVRPRR